MRERNAVALGSAKPFNQVGAGHQLTKSDPVYVCPTLARLDHEVLPVDVLAAISLVSDVFVGFAAREGCAHLIELNEAFINFVGLRAARVTHARLLAHVVKHWHHVDRFAVVALHDGRAVDHADDATADDQIVADGANQFAVEVVLLRLVGQGAFDYLGGLSAYRVLVAVAADDARARCARIKRGL